ncbi:ribose 5-phosphate isomerase [Rhizophagus irregularis]|uniref:Ribose-5-phosphate isomerase n=1 Tax=Rhizophagus irregularis TaxID=588596 RepID=A0A2N0SIN3_9GLOM|nr:ribose 5-phosphate isomerase [Rhizophagus irregularis]
MLTLSEAKKLAAYKAVDENITSEKKIIGIGSGSTVVYVIERIIQLKDSLNKENIYIPTSFQSRLLITEGGLNLGDIDTYPELDVTIDGADEVDENLNAIKGGGACHLREKLVAEAAKKFIIVADYSKRSTTLGEKWKQGVPIEVIPFAYLRVMNSLKVLGCENPILRMAKAKAGPVISDNEKIKLLTGVVEVGLFVNMAKCAYFGNEDGSISIT